MNDEQKNREILELLAGYFSDELSQDDLLKVDTWKNESSDNLKILEEYRSFWNKLPNPSSLENINIEEEWQKLKMQTVNRTAKEITIPLHQNIHISFWLKVAASLLLITVAGYTLFSLFISNPSIRIVSSNAVKTITLPDGSVVTLNRMSELSYEKNYGKTDRKISLKGEAYFEVIHDPQKKFEISTKLINVEVTGTSFNVNARDGHDSVQVLVSNGTVRMYHKNHDQEKIILQKGNNGLYDKNSGKLVKFDTADLNNIAWKTGKFEFNNDSLGYVIDMLNHTYRSQIRIENISIQKCRITASFDNQSLDDILEIIKSTLGLSILHENDSYIIEGPGC